MDKLKYVKLQQDDGTYGSPIPLATDSDHVDVNGNTLTAELATKASASNLTTLTSRVDNLAHLEEGSTTGDAELIDGRISATGTIYENIGNAIRKEFGSLFKSNFIIDYRTSLTDTGYFKNGVKNNTAGFKCSTKILIPQGYNIIVGSGKNVHGNLAIVTFWDSNEHMLSEFTGDTEENTENLNIIEFELEIPVNAKYMAFSAPNSDYSAHDGSIQFYLTVDPKSKRGHALTPYKDLFTQDIQIPEEFYDWNNLPANYIFAFTGISANYRLHSPEDSFGSGIVMTFNYNYCSQNTSLQIFIPCGADGARTYDFFYIRILWNSQWGQWRKIGLTVEIQEGLDIAKNINNIAIFSNNVCDSSIILKDYICWGNDGDYEVASKSDFATVLIPIIPGHTYTASRISFYSTVYNSDKQKIRKLGTEGATNYSYTAINGDAYLALNFRYADTPISKYMVVKDIEMPETYLSYGLLDFTDQMRQKIIDIIKNVVFNQINISNDMYTINGYLSKDTGALQTEAPSFKTTDWIEITEEGAKITGFAKGWNNNIACYAFYDENKEMIQTFSKSNEGSEYSEIVPSQVKYLRFSRAGSDTESNAVITYDKTIVLQQEIDELEERIIEVEDATEFFVDKNGVDDGERHFKKLIDCLWVVQNTEGKKRVYIQNGTYDVLDELGGMEHILAYNTTNNTPYEDGVQPWIDNCELIGRGHVILNFIIEDGTSSDNYWLFSCLNVRGNIKIENIEIHSKNCRYSIHDESGSNYPDTYRCYKNVRCYQNENGGGGGQAIGSGFSARTRVYFDNCYLQSISEPWSCHANMGCSFSFNTTIFKCTGSSDKASLRLSQNGSGVHLYASIANCFLNHGLRVRCEDTQVQGTSETQIDIINTNIPTLSSGYAIVNKQIVSYNTLEGTSEILLDYTATE